MKRNFLFTLLLFAFFFSNAQNLDDGFSDKGVATTSFAEGKAVALDVAIQDDGKIVSAGYIGNLGRIDFGISRHNSDGSPDQGFDKDGKVSLSITAQDDRASSLAIQKDGKILVGGYTNGTTNNDFVVIRLNTDGSLDESFADKGKLIYDLGDDDYLKDLIIQADGKILAAGYSGSFASEKFAVVRILSSGAIDTDFGTNGKSIVSIGSGRSLAEAITLQSNGKIILGGYSVLDGDFAYAVIRFTPKGELDKTFAQEGKWVVGHLGNGSDEIFALATQADDKIVLGGSIQNGGSSLFGVSRLHVDGGLDYSFGDQGTTITNVGSGHDFANDLALLPDDKIVLVGQSGNFGNELIAVSSYLPDGKIDKGFGDKGILRTDLPGGADVGRAVTVQKDGKIIVAGTTGNDMVLLRYEASTSGIEAPMLLGKLALYPNPVAANATLEFDLLRPLNLSVELIDIGGKSIRQLHYNTILSTGNQQLELNLPQNLPSGLYYLKLSDQNEFLGHIKFQHYDK